MDTWQMQMQYGFVHSLTQQYDFLLLRNIKSPYKQSESHVLCFLATLC